MGCAVSGIGSCGLKQAWSGLYPPDRAKLVGIGLQYKTL